MAPKNRIDVGPGNVYLGRPLARVNELFTTDTADGVLRVVWPFRKIPMALMVGATGGGKTTALRVLVWNLICRPQPPILCLADGIPDADSFVMFTGQPGVAHVASGRDQTTAMVEYVYATYRRRLSALGKARAEALDRRGRAAYQAPPPMFLVIDEYLLWVLGLAKRGDAIDQMREMGLNGRKVDLRLLLALQRAGVKDAETGLPGSLKAQLKMRIAVFGESGMDGMEARLAFDDDTLAKRVNETVQPGAGFLKAGGAEGAFRVPWMADPTDPTLTAGMTDQQITDVWALLPRSGAEAAAAARQLATIGVLSR